MRPEPWTEHPAIRCLAGPISTRLGVSPHHRSVQVGALRTHLLAAAFAHAAAHANGTTARVLLRWDDTDRARASSENEAALFRELTEVADIPLAPERTQLPPIRQSDRHHAYQHGLDRLNQLGVTRPAEGGGIALDLGELEALLAASRIDTAARTQVRLVNIRRVPEPQHATLRLTRSDGTMLWHLATVIDDIDFGVNLIVRGTDKIDATGIQEQLRAVLAPDHQAAYLFLPRLSTTAGAPKCRVQDVLSDGISTEALRWFLAENYLLGEEPATIFDQVVDRLRPILPKPRDSRLDRQRLASLDRKVRRRLETDRSEPGAVGTSRIS